MENRATRFCMVMTLIILAQISTAFPAGRVPGQYKPVMVHSAPTTRARPVSQTNIPGPCLNNCRENLRVCIRRAGNNPSFRDRCLKSYRTCLKRCESAPPSKTQPQPKPASVGLTLVDAS
jgi:hypothetical protein